MNYVEQLFNEYANNGILTTKDGQKLKSSEELHEYIVNEISSLMEERGLSTFDFEDYALFTYNKSMNEIIDKVQELVEYVERTNNTNLPIYSLVTTIVNRYAKKVLKLAKTTNE